MLDVNGVIGAARVCLSKHGPNIPIIAASAEVTD
jgi:hypothetical protein